jgi:hypothetical protein
MVAAFSPEDAHIAGGNKAAVARAELDQVTRRTTPATR